VADTSLLEGNSIDLTEHLPLEKFSITNVANIPSGAEKVFEWKEIELNVDIICEGSLVLDHCVITYSGGDEIKGQIHLKKTHR
jgi:uncharacterized protein YuzB (UPF0349 family)